MSENSTTQSRYIKSYDIRRAYQGGVQYPPAVSGVTAESKTTPVTFTLQDVRDRVIPATAGAVSVKRPDGFALVVDPRVLVLDDATASVDATTEAKIRDGLREAMRDRTTIIIAHRLSTIALADEVVVLEGGRVAARGTQAELLTTSAVYREIHEHGLLQGLLKETA